MHDFDVWLSANGFDPAAITDAQKPKLQAAWRAENNGPPVPMLTAPPAVKPTEGTFSETSAAIKAEGERREAIAKLGQEQMLKFARLGNTYRVDKIKDLTEAAMADEKASVTDFKLSMIENGRADPVNVFARSEPEADGKALEAAVCRRAGLGNLEKTFDSDTLNRSEHHFPDGLSLVGLMHLSAQRNGWRGMPSPRSKSWLQAAFGGGNGNGADLDLRAGTTGPSTYSLPNILGNIANKYLRAGFLSVDDTWSRIAARRSVNDFKTITGTRLNGATLYKPVAPGGGEIWHAQLTETTYTNRASTFAIMVGIPREDLINDDVGAFTELSRHMGRGAGLVINDRFWTAFLNNTGSFFTSGNGNTSTGGGSALGTADGAAINAAEVKFMNQTDPNGYPLAIMPRIMLVPPTLRNTAARWMGSQLFQLGGTSGLGGTNIFGGRYTVESSPYMENTSYTGNSTAAWYLLASPDDIPVIEGVALNGRWEPTVETGEADFNQLGVAMRGYIDIGFSLYEFRGGVRSAGS